MKGYVLQPIETPDENAPSPVPGCKVTAKYMGVVTKLLTALRKLFLVVFPHRRF